MADLEVVHIASHVDKATGKPQCIVQWGKLAAVLDPEVVLRTARDLQAAAAHAETDIAFMTVMRERVGMDLHSTASLLADIRTARPMSTGEIALRIHAVAGTATGLPYVHIHRGSRSASLSPDMARGMAMDWTETAVAAYTDARLRYVLGEYPELTPTTIDTIFAGLRAAGGDNTERPNRG